MCVWITHMNELSVIGIIIDVVRKLLSLSRVHHMRIMFLLRIYHVSVYRIYISVVISAQY